MKSYTNLDQSKKLAETIPLESADMYYACGAVAPDVMIGSKQDYKCYTPCWSLAALLKVIPKHIKNFNVLRIDIGDKDFAIWYDEIGYGVNTELPNITMECSIDACVEMIIKLKEKNLL